MDFKTYLLKSGSGQDGHGAQRGRGLGHPQGLERPQLLHDASWKPSLDKKERLIIIPIKIPNKRVNPGITIFDIVAMVSFYYYLRIFYDFHPGQDAGGHPTLTGRPGSIVLSKRLQIIDV